MMVSIADVLMAFTCHTLARRNMSADADHDRIKMGNVMICIIDDYQDVVETEVPTTSSPQSQPRNFLFLANQMSTTIGNR